MAWMSPPGTIPGSHPQAHYTTQFETLNHDFQHWQPRILIDTREQDPLPIARYPSARATLNSGDYSFAGGEHLLAVERKTIPDLVRSLTTERERFTRELERLRGYRFARLLVIGWPGQIEQGHYRSKTPPKAILHSLYSLEAKFVPVCWAPTPQEGAELVERWVFWFARSCVQAAEVIAAKWDGLENSLKNQGGR